MSLPRPSTQFRRSARSSRACLTAALLLVAVAACGRESTGPQADEQIVISGLLTGPNVASLPEGARVALVWGVSATSPDYGYIYGVGTIDRAAGTFTLTLTAKPPAEALNQYGSYALGVGTLIVFGPEVELKTGRIENDGELAAAALGASGQHAVIYTRGSPPSALGWAGAFPAGYAAGRGITQPDNFDGFERVSADSFELIIDDLDNISFVNWT